MISFTLKMAAALPINPIFEVFSRRCGMSDITEAGTAITNLFFPTNLSPLCSCAALTFNLKEEQDIRLLMNAAEPQTQRSPLDDIDEIRQIDKSNMLQFSVEAPKHFTKAKLLAEKVNVSFPK